jgi:hypothetical protein
MNVISTYVTLHFIRATKLTFEENETKTPANIEARDLIMCLSAKQRNKDETKNKYKESDVLTTVARKRIIFYDVTPYSQVEIHRRSGRMHCLYAERRYLFVF